MSSKGKKDSDFHVGSLVFAKLKGFAPWPAKIVKSDKKRYFVYFYGTGEKSTAMKSEDLYDYVKHKAQFVVDKNLKRKFYPEAVEQIETALRGEEDVASINNITTSNTLDTESLDASTTNDVTTDEKSQLDESEQVSQDVEEEDNNTNNSNIASEPATIVEPPVKEAKPSKKSVSKAAKVPPTPPVLEQKATPTQEISTPEPEMVSRSGRKIKTKRYLIDELEETVTPTISKKRGVDSIDSRKSIESTETSPKKAKLMTAAKEVPNPEKDSLLQIESHLIELDHLIKASVGLKNANADKCIEHLKEYKTLKITALMLKKRPTVVHTMKRLRKYVGNASDWEMDDSMKEEFQQKASKIQLMAEEIYSSFKFLFPHNEQKSFWDHFSEKVAEFQTKIKGWTPDEINNLYEEPPTPNNMSPVHSPDKNNGKVE